MNQHETFAHYVKSSSKFQSATPKLLESIPSAFLHLLSGTLCHPISEILLPFRCLNPDSKLTCSRQLSSSRISAVFSPPPPPPPAPTSHLPPNPTLTPRMNVLPECFSCFMVVKRVRVRESAGSRRDGGWGEREYVCMWDKERGRERGVGGACVCVCVCVCVF